MILVYFFNVGQGRAPVKPKKKDLLAALAKQQSEASFDVDSTRNVDSLTNSERGQSVEPDNDQ